jgi:hypothetical protein
MKGKTMKAKTLEGVEWYRDEAAKERLEPGICHSFVASLASALNYIEGELDPAYLMGTSAFAFRIFMNSSLCPSAMSMFDFSAVLPEAIEQAGYQCAYVSRMWDEKELKEQRQAEGHAAIVQGINQDRPAVVWDVAECEWGLIVGYDEKRKFYRTLTHAGQPAKLKYSRLGRNGIDILSVAIPSQANERSRKAIVHKSLEMAVKHAEQREYIDRPDYQNGLAGFDMWAQVMEAGAKLAQAGKLSCCQPDVLRFAEYYAACAYGARCYARDYLKTIANDDAYLKEATACYIEVAQCLQPVWECFAKKQWPEADMFLKLGQDIRNAKKAEKKGIKSIKEYLDKAKPDLPETS